MTASEHGSSPIGQEADEVKWPITAYFGVFGERNYTDYEMVGDAEAIKIVCRWCVGYDMPDRDCAACKNTRIMWIGIG